MTLFDPPLVRTTTLVGHDGEIRDRQQSGRTAEGGRAKPSNRVGEKSKAVIQEILKANKTTVSCYVILLLRRHDGRHGEGTSKGTGLPKRRSKR